MAKNDTTIKELAESLKSHIIHEEDKLEKLWGAVFGDKETNTQGMKDKVDEIHQLLITAKGFKSTLSLILLIAAVIAVLKGWLLVK